MDVKFRMWNNVKHAPERSKYFYDVNQVMECLKQQMIYDTSNSVLGYNHIGEGNYFEQYYGKVDGKEAYIGDEVIYSVAGWECSSCESVEYVEINNKTGIITGINTVDNYGVGLTIHRLTGKTIHDKN